MTQLLMIIAVYAAYGAFIFRFLLHALFWWKGARSGRDPSLARPSVRAFLSAVADLVFFARLLRANGALWLGEWLFHACLVLVMLRHLRYVLEPVPAWVWALQPWGVFAGYLLPCALVLILLVRLAKRREQYTSAGNIVLLIAFFVISVSGVLMHAVWKPELVGTKAFLMGIVTFSPAPWPGGFLLTLHVVTVLLIVPYLPTHMFIAPVVQYEARKREGALHEVLHGE